MEKKIFLSFLALLFLNACRVDIDSINSMGNIAESCVSYGKTRLQWDTHPDTNGDLDGFRLYRGKNINELNTFTLIHDIKNNPTATELYLSQISKPLNSCETNYLYLTAYTVTNIESDPSGVVCWGLGCPAVTGSASLSLK